MTSSEYEMIKEKIASANEIISKTEGGNERIIQQLKNDFEVKTIDKAESVLETISSELESDLKERSELLETLNNAADWDSL